MWKQKIVRDEKIGVGVSAVVLKNNKVLLIKREDLGIWSFPGGRVEQDESLEEAIKREVFEETGIEIKLQKLSGVYIRQVPYLNINFVFKASPIGGKLNDGHFETLEVAWVPIEKSANYFSSPIYLQRIKDAKNPKDQIIFRRQNRLPLKIKKKNPINT